MCAVIGAQIKNPSFETFKTIERLFLESKIRGLHATGISWLKEDGVHTINDPCPADVFLKNTDLKNCVHENGMLYLIGHCRYSTSDLYWNQPIQLKDRSRAIAHNGVITQEPPENWESHYGIKCETKNDSELLLHKPYLPDLDWPDASIAMVMLEKHLVFYRNGKRPLYFSSIEDGCFVFSTRDIGKRAGLSNISKTVAGAYYGMHPYQGLISGLPTLARGIDLQC